MPTPGSSPNGWSNRLRLDDAHSSAVHVSFDPVVTSGDGTPAGLGDGPRIG